MQLLAPEILEEARNLSPQLTGAALALGLLLWLFGSRGYRFWVVLVTTLAAGVYGLQYGPAYGMQPLVAGLLLALAAGTLALALARVAVFAVGGLAALGIRHLLAPGWDEPLVCFLAGGLAGVCLFRLWITVLSSLTGTLLMAYAGLCLADKMGLGDAAAVARNNGPLLNAVCGISAVLGFLTQILLERRRRARQAERKKKEAEALAEERRPRPPAPKPPWWALGQKRAS
jgi:hypothetical protein